MIGRTVAMAGFGVLLAAWPAASAPDPGPPRAFVERLYGAYHGKGPDYLGRQASAVFAPGLLKLIRRDAAEAKGEVGFLDGDPICDCQDFEGLRDLDVKIDEGPAGQARATVRFRISADRLTVRLDLVTVRGHWRVSDVHTKDTPSLVLYLTQSLARPRPKE